MSNQFTPGPWDWTWDSYGKVRHSRKYDCVFQVGVGEIVPIAARIPKTADARLIAAAPQLYDALKTALADLCAIRDGNIEPQAASIFAKDAAAYLSSIIALVDVKEPENS